MANARVLSPIDLRTQEQKKGTTNLQSLVGLLGIVGQAEKVRRERQTLDRIATSIAGGASNIEAINAVARQDPSFSGGIPGLLQKAGGFLGGQGGGVQSSVQQSILSQVLKQALAPQPLLSRPEQRELELFGKRDRPEPEGVPTIPEQRAAQAQKTGALPGTAEFERIAEGPEKPKTTQKSSVITDPNDPNRAIRVLDTFDEQGNRTNREVVGEATLAEKIGGVAAEALQKSTTGKIEKDVIELQGTLGELNQIDSDFDESFFTFRGKATAGISAFLEKAEVPIAKDRQEFLRKKTKFFADSKRVFLKFRKFITGVAGGIEEFREIAKATIDPEKDSPTQFKAKLESMRNNAIRVSNLLLAIKNSGFNPESRIDVKDALQQIPLDSVPLQVTPDVTLETLTGQQQAQGQGLAQQLQPGEILVRDKASGQIGALPENEFDPNSFERIQ